MSEIYNRPIEIYAYHSEPMRTFHEEYQKVNGIQPIRLSYHGREHYNSIVKIGEDKEEEKFDNLPGELEQYAIELSRKRQELIASKKHQAYEETKESAHQNPSLEDLLIKSRQDFEQIGKRDMEAALEESL